MPQRIASLGFMAITIHGETSKTKAATFRLGLSPSLLPDELIPHCLASSCPYLFFRNVCSGLDSERQARPADGGHGMAELAQSPLQTAARSGRSHMVAWYTAAAF